MLGGLKGSGKEEREAQLLPSWLLIPEEKIHPNAWKLQERTLMLPGWWDSSCVATATERSQGQDRARTTGKSVKKSDRSAVEMQAIKEDLHRVREDSYHLTFWQAPETTKNTTYWSWNDYCIAIITLISLTLQLFLAFSDCSTNLNLKTKD